MNKGNRKRGLTVNPLRLSQPAGASLAFMGIRGCIPLWHGVQGCAAFAKILFIQHFREPMPFATTALTQTSVVMGGDGNLAEAVENIRADARCIGVLTTGVAETCGTDLKGTVNRLREQLPGIPLMEVNTPDFEGSLETGWVKACDAALRAFGRPRRAPRKRQAAIFAGPYITPGEVEWLRETFEAFGLRPVIFPDLGDSLFGRLSDADFTTSAPGGIPLEEIETLSDSAFAVSISRSMRETAARFASAEGIPAFHFDHLTSAGEADRFFTLLCERSGQAMPERFRRQRKHLMDTLLDTQFYFHGRTAGVAGDPDFILRWAAPLRGLGMPVVALSSIPFGEFPHGDLRDFKALAEAHGADILIGNSHVAEMADGSGVAAVRAGLPVYDRFGEPQSVRIGYEGLARLYMECANALIACPPEKAAPYRSPLQESLR